MQLVGAHLTMYYTGRIISISQQFLAGLTHNCVLIITEYTSRELLKYSFSLFSFITVIQLYVVLLIHLLQLSLWWLLLVLQFRNINKLTLLKQGSRIILSRSVSVENKAFYLIHHHHKFDYNAFSSHNQIQFS